ncbi:polysaccharide pyruvyl transferase family protein [Candidatus Collinsella stercoripullorum]|uniref:polysaccharide pyruvyl transferase family protein n=1 Tax=Candidatus Collinsella stercoripullorum TaxID=2838522 RepID=UPI0022E4CECA|nr:polysaccharide pyruvyl transferase family protein [Candidatus Collinsella stercoripullorum]
MKDKVGIITFHRSHNCGSMLQAYALQTVVEDMGHWPEIVNFSNEGQRRLYRPFQKVTSLKVLVKNAIALAHLSRIERNDACYERFIQEHFHLSSGDYSHCDQLSDDGYSTVICGSDQVWNITIEDGDDAYFLPWVKKASKVAYAISFGARDISKYSNEPKKYAGYIDDISYISTREKNGQKWIRQLTGRNAPVVLDPTLLLDAEDYEEIEDKTFPTPERYIFYYSPTYDRSINKLVKQMAEKYGLPVICFNTKAFFVKGMDMMGFSLPEREDPSVYLRLMRNATLVVTTSFHGTIFPVLFERPFWTIKNGGMFGDDDRVLTLMDSLALNDRLIPIEFDSCRDYLEPLDFAECRNRRKVLRSESLSFLRDALDSTK